MSRSDSFCRTCLSRENLSPIFTRTNHCVRYTVALFLTTGLQIERDDGLPQMMCSECVGLVNAAIKFRNSSHRAEKTLITKGWRRRKKMEINDNDSSSHSPEHIVTEYDDPEINETVGCYNTSEKEFSSENKITSRNETNSKNKNSTSEQLRLVNGNHQTVKTHELRKLVKKSTRRVQVRQRIKMKEAVKQSQKIKYEELLVGSPCATGPFQCKICKRTLKSKNSFRIHALIHFKYKFMCEHCGKMFPIEAQLRQHCLWRHGLERQFICIVCGHRAVNGEELRIHTRKVHTGERPYICDQCGADFITRRSLSHHVAAHNPRRDVQCKLCPATFKTIQHRNTHITKVHRQRGKTFCKVECYLCEATYMSTSSVRKHLEKAHGVVRSQQRNSLNKIHKANTETLSV